jgi:cell division protein FtsL
MTATPVRDHDEAPKRVFAAYAEAAQALESARTMPLNLQRQWVILFAVAIVAVALVAGLYLDVTARAAITGREIQNLENLIVVNRRANADIETEIARLMSRQVMQERARQAGFEMLERDSINYMIVPGYLPVDGVQFKSDVPEKVVLSAAEEFHESLIDWFARAIQAAAVPPGGVR